ncbi:GD24950 [Drosophila simulans]|uniref:GD24950 n=1 Tax=Drosophila simulans TaxID=7240 RepID=B4QBZ4_DROSI|nr:GD24950 [Drosophila simulans]
MKMNAKILRIRRDGIEIAPRVAALMFGPGICGDKPARFMAFKSDFDIKSCGTITRTSQCGTQNIGTRTSTTRLLDKQRGGNQNNGGRANLREMTDEVSGAGKEQGSGNWAAKVRL